MRADGEGCGVVCEGEGGKGFGKEILEGAEGEEGKVLVRGAGGGGDGVWLYWERCFAKLRGEGGILMDE